MRPFEIVIAIPTIGDPAPVKALLDRLAACDIPANLRATYVVENGGGTRARAVVEAAPAAVKARYLWCAEPGKSRALNHALAQLDDELVVFLDADVRPDCGVIAAYAEAASAEDEPAYFGGECLVDYEQPPAAWVRAGLPPSAAGFTWTKPVLWDRRTRFLGFNWAVFAEDLRRVGGYNESLGPGADLLSVGDETEAMNLLLIAGLKARWVPDAKVWHHVPADKCGPLWGLRRAYLNGIYQGLGSSPAAQEEHAGPARFLLSRSVDVAAAGMRNGRAGGFRALSAFAKALGERRGQRLAAAGADGGVRRRQTQAFLARFGSSLPAGDAFAIFGAGSHGQSLLRSMRNLRLDVDCFIDNDKRKWDTRVAGIPVRSPRAIRDDHYVLVASAWAAEIARQLESQGLLPGRRYQVIGGGRW